MRRCASSVYGRIGRTALTQLEIIKEQYQSSMYKEYDMSGENEKLFKIQPVSDDLKTLISLQL